MKNLLTLSVVLCCLLASFATRAQEPTIPSDLVITPVFKPIPAGRLSGAPVAVSTLSVGNIVQAIDMPTCVAGNLYLGVQLFYDFAAARQTEVNWSADLTITLLNNTTVLWTKPLSVKTTDQIFETTVFHDATVTCSSNYKIRIDAKNVTGSAPQANIKLQVLLFKKFEDVFVPSTTFTTFDCSGQTKTWTYPGPGAIAYDLEYVLIPQEENYTPSTISAAFSYREPVRVTTAASLYKHNYYYPDGKLYYRIRAVGFNPAFPEHRICGAWQYYASSVTTSAPAGDTYQKKLTWQEHTVFIDGGKYKRILTFFDGSFRQRQRQTTTQRWNKRKCSCR